MDDPTYLERYAALGRQEPVVGDGTLASATKDPLVGVELEPGTYEYLLPIRGASRLQVDLVASAVTGNVAPTIARTYSDRTPIGTPTAFDNLVQDAAQTVEITDLCGEHYARLTIVVPAEGALTLSRAEYRAL